MKAFKIFALLGVLTSVSFGQTDLDNLMKKVGEETCQYLGGDDLKGLKGSALEMKLGVFLLKKYTEYEDDFKAAGYEMNMLDDNSGYDFGTKVALKMADYCPEALINLAVQSDDMNVEDSYSAVTAPAEVDEATPSIKGTLSSVDNGPISYFTVKDDLGKSHTFLVVEEFNDSDLLSRDYIGTPVIVFYKVSYYYDISENDYIKQKVVIGLN